MNKKKLLITVLTLVLVLSMVFGLVACDNTNTDTNSGTETEQGGGSNQNGEQNQEDVGQDDSSQGGGNYPEPKNYATFWFQDDVSAKPIQIKIDTDKYVIPKDFTLKDLFTKDTTIRYGFKATVTNHSNYWTLDKIEGEKLIDKQTYRPLLPNKLQFISIYSDDEESTFDKNTVYNKNGIDVYMTNSIDQVKLKQNANYMFILEENAFSIPKKPNYEKDYSKEATYGATLSDPLLIGNDAYFVKSNDSGLTLNKVDKTGKDIKSVLLSGESYWVLAKPVVVDNKIICVTGGCVEAFDINTLDKVWEYKNGLTNLYAPYEITVDEVAKAIYIGFFNDFTTNGKLVALKADGTQLFEDKEKMGGFYHGKSTIVGNYLITINTKNNKNYLISYNKTTGEVVDEKIVNGMVRNETILNGQIESEIVYRPEDRSVYYTISERDSKNNAVRKASYVIRTIINKDTGIFGNSVDVKLSGIKSDGVPVFFGNRMYVSSGNGSFNKPTGEIQVIDVTTMQVKYSVKTTALVEGKPCVKVVNNNGVKEAFVFYTTNSSDGKLKYFVDREKSDHSYEKEIFAPTNTNYTTGSVEIGEDGTMYYRLDGGHLYAYSIGF